MLKYVIIALVLIAVIIIALNIKIVPQSKAYVIERLGTYRATWQTGLHVKLPIFERVAKIVSLKEQVVDFDPQPVITKDNVTMQTPSFSSRLPTRSYTATALKDRFRQSKTSPLRRFVTSSVSLSLTTPSPPVTPLTRKSEEFLMKPPTRGASRSTVLSLRTFFRPVRFRTPWKSR